VNTNRGAFYRVPNELRKAASMIPAVRAILALAALLAAVVAVACGGETDAVERILEAPVVEERIVEANVERVIEVETERASERPASDRAPQESDLADDEFRQTSLQQNRIIVHTAKMSLVVENVARTVDDIVDVAHRLGGWVVNSDRESRHSGTIAIRVPADRLDEAFLRLGALALEVESRSVSSEDVTEEYFDSQARLGSLRATEQRLLTFLDRAGDIEDALLVQEAIVNLQQQIDAIEGRLTLLERTSAYSLIEIDLKLAAEPIPVDAGGDVSVRVGQDVRFRATFWAPADMEEVRFVWDFGDGSKGHGSESILRPDGTRVTSTVTHTYDDDRDSPYIVRIELSGFGDDGIGEGSDSLEVTVSHVPTIEVFAGEDRTVAEGAEEDYRISFTRPGELWDYEYRWEFGDGSPTVTGSPDEGKTRVETAHVFTDHRPTAYQVTVTVSAMSETGRISGSDSFSVTVTEVQGFLILGWDIGATAKSALRALLAVISVATRILIWMGILSPVFIVLGAALYLWNRFRGRKIRPGLPPWPGSAGGRPAAEAPPAAPQEPEADPKWPPPPGDEPPPEQAGPASGDTRSP
ncbi:MAG: DUF4349 domain-containing protein, partial [Dehalococcoidia bacterium]|nr:DUF4349 domain-containing protein [Dehalococcoidia bacterium]